LSQPATPTYGDGDFNYDGVINIDDYVMIDSAFLGQDEPLESRAIAAASVPEPAGIVGAIMIGSTAGSRRWRRRRTGLDGAPWR
jgi:hypothetical protein